MNCNAYPLSIAFSGSLDLLKFILKKYTLYNGSYIRFLKSINYKVHQRRSAKFYQYGISARIWNTLYKELIILKLRGVIEFDTMNKLLEEYESTK